MYVQHNIVLIVFPSCLLLPAYAFGIIQKRDKRRWPFRKPNYDEPGKAKTRETSDAKKTHAAIPNLSNKQKQAIVVATATAAAAVATAKAAVEMARLRDPSGYNIKQNYAATVIQTAFRGYLVSRTKPNTKTFKTTYYV